MIQPFNIQTNKPTILVVDDETANRELLELHLADAGYEVVQAASGKEALNFVISNSVDLVLLDVVMPDMSGFEVCTAIKANGTLGFIPVVLVTMLSDVSSRVQANEAQADDFLSKPVHHEELISRVRSLLRLKETHKQLLEANRQVQKQNEELLKLQQIKEDLAALLVHDLQNPLATIQGYLEATIQGPDELSEFQDQFLTGALDGCRELREMVLNLLDLSVLEAGEMPLQPEPTDLHELADSVARAGILNYESMQVDFRNELSDSLPEVYADKNMMKRVLSNLLGNALKFSPNGGTIRTRGHLDNNRLICSVVDEGPGVPTEYHERIFDKFVRLEWQQCKGRSGRGLGLAFCKLAVEAHGGQIWVDPTFKSGSQFCFSLPLRDVNVPSDAAIPTGSLK